MSYSGSGLWTQGKFDNQIFTNIGKISKKPTDPLLWTDYTYSVTYNKQEYQVAASYESNTISYARKLNVPSFFPTAYADFNYAIVRWNYNGYFIQKDINGTHYVFWVPSILWTQVNSVDILSLIQNKQLIVQWYTNVPWDYIWKWKGGSVWWVDWVPTSINDVIVYSGSIEWAKTDTWVLQILLNLQKIYTGSTLMWDEDIKNFLRIDPINNQSWAIAQMSQILYPKNFVSNTTNWGYISSWNMSTFSFVNLLTSLAIDENSTLNTLVQTITSQESNSHQIQYSISGTDSSFFTIGATTGDLKLNFVPDWEIPVDSNQDNVYAFTVNANNGTDTISSPISLTVNDLTGVTINDDGISHVVRGTDEQDTIYWNWGSDVIYWSGAADFIDAGSGDDRVWAGRWDDNINGSSGNDIIYGEDGNDTINGSSGNDTVSGWNGNDILTWSSGYDFFLFTEFWDTNYDTVTDFVHLIDVIQISGVAFWLTPWSSAVVTVWTETTTEPQFVLDSTTHILYFDANGSINGLTDAQKVATLNGITTLSSSSISIV